MHFIPTLPQEAAMIIAGGIGMAFYFGCSLKCRKRCDPGKLILFAGSTVAIVAGVYVFFQALSATLNPANQPVGMQNAVWAAIGGLALAFFTLDLIIDEMRALFKKPAEPEIFRLRDNP